MELHLRAETYSEAQESILRAIFSTYPNVEYKSLRISINCTKPECFKKIHKCIDRLPSSFSKINNDSITIEIPTINDLVQYWEVLNVILSVSRYWKGLRIYMNDVDIPAKIALQYLIPFLSSQSGTRFWFEPDANTLPPIKQKSIKSAVCPNLDISILTKEDIMSSVIVFFVEKYFSNLTYRIVFQDSNEAVVALESDTLFYFLLPSKDIYPYSTAVMPFIIQELTFNDFFTPNGAELARIFLSSGISLSYLRFRGVNRHRQCNEYGDFGYFDYVDVRHPELKLVERYNAYPGRLYHVVVFEMTDTNGDKAYNIGLTKGKVHQFVLKVCKELESKNWNSLLANGVAGLTNSSWEKSEKFYQAFNSWKGTTRRWRLENILVYFSFDTWIKDEDALYRTIDRICVDIDNGRYADEERATFQKPINKWKSEEHVFNIAKHLYGNYQVLYQHRPFFLKTEKGQLSYDIYICGMKVAIEYQGKQHYEPVDFFGGEEHFLSQKERDAEKMRLSKENGIALVYINYWESITPMLIQQKVEEALQERDHQ